MTNREQFFLFVYLHSRKHVNLEIVLKYNNFFHRYSLKQLPKDYYQQTLKALPSDYYQPQASEQQAAVVAAPGQYANVQNSQAREGKAYYDQSNYQFQTTTEPEPTVSSIAY